MNGLGSVSVDIHKREREFENLTLSDTNVVKYLLLYRSKVDEAYDAKVNIDANQAGDLFEFNQELICLYASIDKLLSRITLKEKDSKFLNLIFEGNTIPDVIEYHDYPRKTAYRTLDRIVDKIVEANNADWVRVMNDYISKK